jgi:hypothetical protein
MAGSRPTTVRDRLEATFRLYCDGKLSHIRGSTKMNLTQVQDGLQTVQRGNFAKVVILPTSSDIVSVVPKPTTPYQFDSDATYVLAGGYGGLGRSLARWMASRGARNLIFLSRSSASSTEKRQMATDLEKMGCRIVDHACDVSDITTLQPLSNGHFSYLPPIKGCIQASMVLKVSFVRFVLT